jgi:hypothetical protein
MRRWMRCVCVYSIHHHDRDGQGIEVKVLLSLFTGILLFFSLFFYYYYLFPVPFFFFVAELTLCVCVCICRCIHTTSIEYEWGRGGRERGTSRSWRRVPLVDVPRSILCKRRAIRVLLYVSLASLSSDDDTPADGSSIMQPEKSRSS